MLRQRTKSALIGLALAGVLGCARREPPATLPTASDSEPFRDVPIGLCEDHPPESTSEQRLREDFAALQRAGVRLLRVSFGWDDLEPERDRYDFAPVDQLLRIAAEYGVRLIPYVCYTPAWLAPEGAAAQDIYRSPPREPAEFGQLMELLARRYKGRFASWELWNEPDNREYWLGTASEYAALLAAGARGVRRGDPEARVVLGGIAGHLDFLEELLKQHQVASDIDVVNLHSYSETWNAEPLEGLSDYLEQAAHLVRSYGEGEPLWLAEVGYSSFRRGDYISDWYTARFDFEHTPGYQAAALLRVLAMARHVSEVELIAWYELRDLPPGTEVIGDHNNRHLGVLTPEGSEKPAFRALARALPLLSGPLRPRPLRVLPSPPARAAQVEARAFQSADGRCVIVAWLARHQLPSPAREMRARFALDARTTRASAHTFDALGELSRELALEARSPVRTAELALEPQRTHVIVLDDCH